MQKINQVINQDTPGRTRLSRPATLRESEAAWLPGEPRNF